MNYVRCASQSKFVDLKNETDCARTLTPEWKFIDLKKETDLVRTPTSETPIQ